VTGIRNLGVAAGSLAAVGLLMLYPTSTNSRTHRRPGVVAVAPGIVRPSAPAPTGGRVALVTVNGTSEDTAYGPVQVQIQLRGSRIVKAVAVDYPQGSGRDQEINGYAIPVLQDETLRAQSAQVDTVSGATYTSDGYRRSLQAALDAAHTRP
jgi:uncharacterized protein with FMN-binding domain